MKRIKDFPAHPGLKKLMGPSFLLMALALGAGELILWPYLVANYGLGLIWAALLALSFQFFVNLEIQRYTLVRGESIFVGLARRFRWAPSWLIVSTFLGFGLPGIISASAQILANIFGWSNFRWLGIGLLLAIGVLLTIGKKVFSTMEKITQTIVLLGVPFVLFLMIYLVRGSEVVDLARGLVGLGNDYYFLPAGISLGAFLVAFVFVGAGGNLNLTQSVYIKEHGYGMAKYVQKISGLFFGPKKGNSEKILLTGVEFDDTRANKIKFNGWWQLVNKEQALVFLGLGGLAILMLALLAYSAVYGLTGNDQGILFIIKEAGMIGGALLPWIGTLFLLFVGLMLFQAQLNIADSASRMMAENFVLLKNKDKKETQANLSKIYFVFLWAQIALGVGCFLFNFYEPKTLLIIAGAINAVAMLMHVAMTTRLNRSLPDFCQPRPWRKAVIGLLFAFMAGLGVVALAVEIIKFFK